MSDPVSFSEEDRHWMTQAIQLAKRATGLTAPNPIVGAVVVKDGVLLGKGWHHKAGEPHAEPNALADAGEKTRGATLYVTMEPCSTYGRTPPCTERIKAAGIQRVVFGSTDRNPKHAGAATAILQEAGIEVTVGCLAEECDDLNRDFFWWINQKRPYVVLKMAMTLDGKIATASGNSRWISGSEAREFVQGLRKQCGAIMVGGETVRLDNPSLLIRDALYPRQPRRFVWSSRSLPLESQMLHDHAAPPQVVKPTTRQEWLEFLAKLGQENIVNLLLEGGGELAASALQCGIVNKIYFIVAPKILCGRESRPVVGGQSPQALSEAISLEGMTVSPLGKDFLFQAELQH